MAIPVRSDSDTQIPKIEVRAAFMWSHGNQYWICTAAFMLTSYFFEGELG